MSRKLQAQIQDIKGLPGKFKRILLAWASFANNDGTNIFPAKETVAERAGVSRWTVYDNSGILEAADVLQRAGSHVCKTERCNKGGTHWTSRHGHYTAVYKINVALLGNPTLLLQKIAKATVEKSNSGTVGKIQPGTVGKPDATQALKETPAPLGITEDSSALTSGISKEDSEALAPLAVVANSEEKPVGLTSEEEQLLRVLLPVHGADMESDPKVKTELHAILLLTETVDVDAADLLRWNRIHKKGALYIRTVEQFKRALFGNESGTYALVNEYIEHDVTACKPCHEGRTGDGRARIKGYAQTKAERDQVRSIEEKRQWLRTESWNFIQLDNSALVRFREIIQTTYPKGTWAPSFKMSDALAGDRKWYYVAAVRKVNELGKPVSFAEFEHLVNTAWHYSRLQGEVKEYDKARGLETSAGGEGGWIGAADCGNPAPGIL